MARAGVGWLMVGAVCDTHTQASRSGERVEGLTRVTVATPEEVVVAMRKAASSRAVGKAAGGPRTIVHQLGCSCSRCVIACRWPRCECSVIAIALCRHCARCTATGQQLHGIRLQTQPHRFGWCVSACVALGVLVVPNSVFAACCHQARSVSARPTPLERG